MKKLSKILLISLLAVFLAVGSASATAFLKLDDGVTTLEIQDGDVLDAFVGEGVVAFTGSLGGVWSANVLTGFTKPILGTALEPKLDFNTSNAGGPGTLMVSFSDTDFTGSGPIPFNNWLGGTTDGTISIRSYYDLGNVAFAETVQISDSGPQPQGPYFDSADGWIILGDEPTLYSITIVAEITHSTPNDVTSLDNEMFRSVPEPATMLLLGSGFIGLVGFRRKKFFKK